MIDPAMHSPAGEEPHLSRFLRIVHPPIKPPWANPLHEVQYERRSFDVDVKSCVGCGGRMTVRAVVTDPASIDKLLRALQRPSAPPAAA